MKVTLIGYRALDFKTDSDEKIKGTQVFVSFPTTSTFGEETAKYFMQSDMELPSLVIGNEYDLQFNHRGKVIAMLD